MSQGLKTQFEYYLDNQEKFVQEYNGKVIVLKDNKVVGVYDTEIDAVTKTQKDHELGTFLVQRVSPGSEAYTVTIYSYLMNAAVA